MQTFNLFIEDDRYAIPTLAFVTAPNTRTALELAWRRLEESPHHLAVEVCDGDELLAELVREARGARSA